MKRFVSIKYIGRLGEFLDKRIQVELSKVGYPSLSASHFEILTFLFRKGDACNMSSIATEIQRKKPTVTILIQKLESLGLVKKTYSDTDKRETKIYLTNEGKKFRPIAYRISTKLLSLKSWGISPEESSTLDPILNKIYNHCQNQNL
ncbi:MarR family winged helix-turn-helix transcriptional regulator [Leptospira sp. GIMC2001]|uniref:MarR family winged helix-turn-helix transcriptional regulator n=1 Tax=Leptospira sp. GIMC2001 TaxID=1513297 RepID=UPI0023498C13|nr:MarR family transcriptional regulator [Leptospira sp. GIMC2001]WCL48784.1 MarR family transcriptional regulator [Leptospira sp. GIMC2001]